MATLSDLRTTAARALRDTGNATFSVAELDDLINQGIDELADVYPREIVATIGTVAANVTTYSVSAFTNIYRVDVSDGTYRTALPHGVDGADSGWETHAGIIYLPPSWPLTNGNTLKVFGYGRYVQLSASTQTTDLDVSGINAVIVFVQVEAFQRLVADRAKFQQWQSNSNNTDVTALGVAQLAGQATARWRAQRQRLRHLRKLG